MKLAFTPAKETWSDVTKGIRDKVNSKVQGFENQKFIQKSELLYNFKNNEPAQSSLRSSTAYMKNHMDNKFPKQESPIKMGLSNAIYSPVKRQHNPLDDLKSSYFTEKDRTKASSTKKELFVPSKSSSDVQSYCKPKGVSERTTMAEIIRISNHLQDVQATEASQLSSAYLQELMTLQQNIGKVLKQTNRK